MLPLEPLKVSLVIIFDLFVINNQVKTEPPNQIQIILLRVPYIIVKPMALYWYLWLSIVRSSMHAVIKSNICLNK